MYQPTWSEPNGTPRLRFVSSRLKPRPLSIQWADADPLRRGPVIAGLSQGSDRNAIGAYGGPYSVYRALATATGQLAPDHRPNLENTAPTLAIGPFPSWSEPGQIVTLDPWGATVAEVFGEYLAQGYDVRPTIAVTQAQITIPELAELVSLGTLTVDGEILRSPTTLRVSKIAIEPVWHLPSLAERLEVPELVLRQALFWHTGGMFPELTQRLDLEVFLPPIGGTTVYVMGDLAAIEEPSRAVTVRIHDECNGSDVFGSDICTCRPYLVHGIEEGIRTAQEGGVGLMIYNRKEGRALGEVTKFLVYNARKRQVGGDRPSTYFERTECVAGVQDMRFQVLMPDVLHWLGLRHIDRLVSMSHLKYEAIVGSGITVGERVALPGDRIPLDAQVEMQAKQASGYYGVEALPEVEALGRGLVE